MSEVCADDDGGVVVVGIVGDVGIVSKHWVRRRRSRCWRRGRRWRRFTRSEPYLI